MAAILSVVKPNGCNSWISLIEQLITQRHEIDVLRESLIKVKAENNNLRADLEHVLTQLDDVHVPLNDFNLKNIDLNS